MSSHVKNKLNALEVMRTLALKSTFGNYPPRKRPLGVTLNQGKPKAKDKIKDKCAKATPVIRVGRLPRTATRQNILASAGRVSLEASL